MNYCMISNGRNIKRIIRGVDMIDRLEEKIDYLVTVNGKEVEPILREHWIKKELKRIEKEKDRE